MIRHVILDLDLTLIHTKPNSFKLSNERAYVKHIKNSTQQLYIPAPHFNSKIYLRPHLLFFLDHLFEEFTVSIWTAGQINYCEFILRQLLPDSYIQKIKWVLARNNDTYHIVSGITFFQNGFSYNDKKIPFFKIVHKSFSYVLKPVEQFATVLKEDITGIVLLDDNIKNTFHIKNSKNVYLIQRFQPRSRNDNELVKFMKWLKANKRKRNNTRKAIKTKRHYKTIRRR